MPNRIYLDYAATTPLDAEVLGAMAAVSGPPQNASSNHLSGRSARNLIDAAREIVSDHLGCLFGEVIFTSSGTESANLALIGTCLDHQGARKRILIGSAEHHCVLNTSPVLGRLGYHVELVNCGRGGEIDLDHLASLLSDDVLLVAAMTANNETGAWNDLLSVRELTSRHGALLFVDAVQTTGWYPSPLATIGPDLLRMSAHKFHGPLGAGALYVRAGTGIVAEIRGGGQERDMRAGTENIPAIVGMAKALELREADPNAVSRKKLARDAFATKLEQLMGDRFTWVVDREKALEGHAHLRFPGIKAETFLIRLDRAGVEASSGAACSTGSIEPSHVLLAAGYSADQANEALRFTFGSETGTDQAERAAEIVAEIGTTLVG